VQYSYTSKAMPADYSGQNLRGRNFKGKNLEGANFSGADIRSANFTGANLKGANFSHAKAGLQRRWATFLMVVSLAFSGLSGFLSAFAGFVVAALIFHPEKGYEIAYQIAGFAVIAIFIIFFLVTIRQGIQAGLGAGAFAVAGTVAVAGAGAFAVSVVLFSIYISLRALKGDPKHALIRHTAVAFAAFRGTSFRSADLTDANFTEATLKSTDLRKANLTRTCWRNAEKLDRVRPGKTYLQNALLRQVLVTGLGEKQIFDQQNLRGVNLQKAHLKDASFIATDLSEANLQDADLSRAKLVQTQLDQTDLTGAILTGAYIEEWNISTDTKLHGIRCDYVFMRLPPEKRPDFLALPPLERLDENPRRKPDDWNRNFTDGEFADFIAPLVQTLDLYHNKVVDPRFIAMAFQQLKEAHPEAELEIISIEKKGKNRDKIHIKAETSPQADCSTLHADYFANLEYLQSLPPDAQQALLAERAAMIKMLAGLLGSSSKASPEISIVNNNFQNQENDPRNINIDEGNYNENIKGNYIQGDSSDIIETPMALNQIKCNKCSFNNPQNYKFCSQCGTQIIN
jgi:uncharacterized protein YjbI with pentapeptide repeats